MSPDKIPDEIPDNYNTLSQHNRQHRQALATHLTEHRMQQNPAILDLIKFLIHSVNFP